jgi:hypothetical protein
MSASNFILPWLQQGQVVMSLPVSCSIICSRQVASIAGGGGNFNCLRMVFQFGPSVAISQKAVVSDSDKSLGQAVEQKVSDKLHGANSN